MWWPRSVTCKTDWMSVTTVSIVLSSLTSAFWLLWFHLHRLTSVVCVTDAESNVQISACWFQETLQRHSKLRKTHCRSVLQCTVVFIYPVPDRGTGYCNRVISLFVCFFVCFFVSKITRKGLERFAWNFQGKCGVTMGWPDYILGQCR